MNRDYLSGIILKCTLHTVTNTHIKMQRVLDLQLYYTIQASDLFPLRI